MTNSNIRIIFTDLDGTLLNSERLISQANLTLLEELGENKIVRVIATGRSLFSFRRLFRKDIPADFLIFSTGAGIVDLSNGAVLHSEGLRRQDIRVVANHLQKERADFMVHHAVPDNHRFFYWGNRANSDFNRRIELYREYAEEFTAMEMLPELSAQIIAIFPEDLPRFNRVKQGLADYQITRTTSPLDGRSIWMEILPARVGKGAAAAWLCRHLDLDSSCAMAIGNDYNDLCLLEYAGHSYVVANAPEEMLRDFTPTLSNNEDGFYHAARAAMFGI